MITRFTITPRLLCRVPAGTAIASVLRGCGSWGDRLGSGLQGMDWSLDRLSSNRLGTLVSLLDAILCVKLGVKLGVKLNVKLGVKLNVKLGVKPVVLQACSDLFSRTVKPELSQAASQMVAQIMGQIIAQNNTQKHPGGEYPTDIHQSDGCRLRPAPL
jgi:hypothetical protein